MGLSYYIEYDLNVDKLFVGAITQHNVLLIKIHSIQEIDVQITFSSFKSLFLFNDTYISWYKLKCVWSHINKEIWKTKADKFIQISLGIQIKYK